MASAAPRTFSPASLPEAAPAGGRALLPGAMLAEFEFGHVIGESRFAVVYAATDHSLDRQVAIKEYLPASLTHRSEGVKVQLRSLSHAHAFERGRRAFIEEAKQLARCDHPSLLRVHRIVHANGTVYRVMPHVSGTSLQAVRQQMHAPPDEASLRSVLGWLLGALDALHRQGLVHGEVSPAKILLPGDGGERPLLLDFGAVRRGIVGDPTRNWMSVLGTTSDVLDHEADAQQAAAPYRWPGDGPAGPWNDVSALAATMYFWITGHWPEYPPAEPLSRVVGRLREYLPQLDYSAPLLQAIDVALAPRLRDRPQGVAQFRDCLGQGGDLLPQAAATSVAAAVTAPPAAPQTSASAFSDSAPAPTVAAAVDTVDTGDAASSAPVSATAAPTPPKPATPAASRAAGLDDGAARAAGATPVDLPVLDDPLEPAAEPPDRERQAARSARRRTPGASSRSQQQQRRLAQKRKRVAALVVGIGMLVLGGAGWQMQQQRQNELTQAGLANAMRNSVQPRSMAADLLAEPTAAGPLSPVVAAADPVIACRSQMPSAAPSALAACLQRQCDMPAWSQHSLCLRLRDTGRPD